MTSLGITEWVLRGEPTNEDEFKEMFQKSNRCRCKRFCNRIFMTPSDFGVTWKQVTDDRTRLTPPMVELRRQRNAKLAETDFYALSDNTMTSDNMKTYRQQLRDLPASSGGKDATLENGELKNVTWLRNQHRFIMRTSDDVLDNVLGITDVVETTASQVTLPEVVPPQSDSEDTDNDYKYQRENFYRLVERGQDAIDGILELARESEHPRSYEVGGQLIKNVADVTEKLGDLQTKMKKLKEVPNSAPKNVTNALFVGSTAELQKMLKGKE